jgi:hypothetical protein
LDGGGAGVEMEEFWIEGEKKEKLEKRNSKNGNRTEGFDCGAIPPLRPANGAGLRSG